MPDQTGLTVVQRWLLRHAQRNPRPDLQANYARLVGNTTGQVVEIGCGPGGLFRHYPASVSALIAVEINAGFRDAAMAAATEAAIPIRVVNGSPTGGLPLPDGSADVVVCCEVLCSAAEPRHLLAEARRVLRPGGELRVYEHSLSTRLAGRLAQRTVDLAGWPRMLGGCHAAQDVVGLVGSSGFTWVEHQRLWIARLPLTWPIGPHVLGVAKRS